MDYIDQQLLKSLLLRVSAGLILTYLQQQESFCYGKRWSKCGINRS